MVDFHHKKEQIPHVKGHDIQQGYRGDPINNVQRKLKREEDFVPEERQKRICPNYDILLYTTYARGDSRRHRVTSIQKKDVLEYQNWCQRFTRTMPLQLLGSLQSGVYGNTRH